MTDQRTQQARALRKAMTGAERMLWSALRQRGLGARFRRQAPVGPYVLDFVCFAQRLVVECDGGQHGEPLQAAYDEQRSRYLAGAGYRVLRFWNNEVMGNLEGVLQGILVALGEGAPSPPPQPSPARGEGALSPSP